MLRALSAFFLVSLAVCSFKVSADRDVLPQLRRLRLKEVLKPQEHYKNTEHNLDFDHDAFLGHEIALEWKKLPTAEVKEKLRSVAL